MDKNKNTVVFDGDLRKMNVNPFKVVSPFGDVITCGVGDAFAENDELKARIAELEAALQKFVDYDSADDDDGVLMMLNYNDAITAARAALGEKE